MSKKSTKTKAPKATKAGGKPKAKAKSDAATPQPAESAPAEAGATDEQTTEVAAAAPEATAGLQIKKDAKGRFWVVAKDGGQEHGPYNTKQQATDAKVALASGAA